MNPDRLIAQCKDKKAVFLDLDNTLYPYLPCHQAGLKTAWAVYKKLVMSVPYKSFERLYDAARKDIKTTTEKQAASHSRLLYFQRMLEISCGKTFYKETLALEEAYWAGYMEKMKLNRWVLPFLKTLKKSGRAVIIVTDLTAAVQLRKVEKLRIKKYIDYLVSSEEAGIEKPADEIFRLALRKAGCLPLDAVMIGDDASKDAGTMLPFIQI